MGGVPIAPIHREYRSVGSLHRPLDRRL